jgi:peptide-methionine (S)-S-oxide reductase
LALGCFWGPQYHFDHLNGISKTRVGYSGGKFKNPTYHDLSDNAETIEITYDPKKISYSQILTEFLYQHNPTANESSRYRSIIMYMDESQKQIAKEVIADYEAKTRKKIVTEIQPFSKFYLAEEYHQKYYEKNNLKE